MADTIDLGLVTAYGNAKEGGYTGTESQFNTMLANLPTYASNAAASATAAAASASDAEDAADRAEAIVGGQFVSYGQTQGLSDAQQEQARANISAGASNRNLLDNPFFTIRQMGTGGVTGVGYAVDRWKNTDGANLTQTPRSPYGITFASSSGYQVDQALWDYPAEYLAGKTLTISVMTSGGNIAQATGVFTATSSTAAKVAVTSADGNFTVGLYYIPSALAVPFVRITTPSGKLPVNAPILAAKLELGSYSTLANDVPPDYKTELDKCQYYYRELKAITATYLAQGVSVAGTNFRVILPYTMRTRPTVTYSGTLTAYYSGGNAPVTAISVTGTISDAVQLSFTTSGISGANQPVSLDAAAGAKICLSADL